MEDALAGSQKIPIYNYDLNWPIIFMGGCGAEFATHPLSLLRGSSVQGFSDSR